MVSFDIASVSRVGHREVNEDYADFLQARDATCWVLADGLGGHRGGATAAKAVVEAALRSFAENPEPTADAVRAHVDRAQAALGSLQAVDPALAQMRSTIVVLVGTPRTCVWAHVGDSRLYQLRDGRVMARTRDHSVSQMLVDGGQIAAKQQGAHEDRGRLLRCLGHDRADRDLGTTVSGPHPIACGDAFLLCSDGFWEVLDDVALELDYAGAEDAAAWIERLEARLCRHLTPDHDNYTAVGIYVTDRQGRDREDGIRDDASDAVRDDARDHVITKRPPPRRRRPRRRPVRVLSAALGVVALSLVALGIWKGDTLIARARAWFAPRTIETPPPDTNKTGPRDDERPRAHP